MTYYNIFNFSNKISIILTILLFYLIPFFDYKIIFKNLKSISLIEILSVIGIFIICLLLFDYKFTNYFGGGYFFKLSNLLLDNNILFFIVFFISLLFFIKILNYNFYNYTLIFILLICFNLQYTIYLKYYDPLLLILFFLLFDISLIKTFLKKRNFLLRIYFFMFIIYFIFSTKNYINEILLLIV